ncbi:GGDEF domain-containing protein [Lonsdalea populi]|uniref:GGDEF domain-containing protein n=1 Tax=Lonsdalea populi TaxID=1172565 RepID=UPI000B8CE036|nr:GGDEF domain-containing protein [Lonsdalea populi]
MNKSQLNVLKTLSHSPVAFVLFGIVSFVITACILLNTQQKNWQEEKRYFDNIIQIYESFNNGNGLIESDHGYKIGDALFSRVVILSFQSDDVVKECIHRLSSFDVSISEKSIVRVCQNKLPAVGELHRKDQLTSVLPLLSSTDDLIGIRIRFATLNGPPAFDDVFSSSNALMTLLSISLLSACLGTLLALLSKKYLIELPAIARYDDLTGCLRRDAFFQATIKVMRNATQQRQPLCVLLIDLDHFKKVNDTLGHAAGDETLREVADLIRHYFRKGDILGRLGGDEFAVVLPNTDLDNAYRVSERIRQAIDEMKSDSFPNRRLTISIGLVEYYAGEETMEQAIHRADIKLYTAKIKRNRVEK